MPQGKRRQKNRKNNKRRCNRNVRNKYVGGGRRGGKKERIYV